MTQTPSRLFLEGERLLRTIARTAVLSYFVFLLLESLLPGFVTYRLRLDFFLGIVIISVALWHCYRIIHRTSS